MRTNNAYRIVFKTCKIPDKVHAVYARCDGRKVAMLVFRVTKRKTLFRVIPEVFEHSCGRIHIGLMFQHGVK